LDDPLIYVRAIHYAAAITVAGVVFFLVFIGEPAFRNARDDARLPAAVRGELAWLAWVSLLLTIASGAAWFILVAASMGERPVAEVFSEGFLGVVLLQTEFGRAWLVRAILAGLLAAIFAVTLTAKPKQAKAIWLNVVGVATAAGLVGMLAWGGHAAGGAGAEGIIHPAPDFLHLTAAAAWLGALIPLALLLRAAADDTGSLAVARIATLRFSAFGVASVTTLLVTGLVNTFYLVGSIQALAGTDYGRLLAAKVALFFVMVAVAAINRFRLTPRLVPGDTLAPARHALRQLRRNALIEIALGAVIIAIVAKLGVTPPAFEQEAMPPEHHHTH
jgi:putative copper resistance protein D